MPSGFKYYAVRVGRNPGVYTTWSSCKQQVINFPNAVYKAFEGDDQSKVLEICRAFVNNTQVSNDAAHIQSNIPSTASEWENHMNDETYAFVDGSFNAKTNVYGYGGFISHKKENENDRLIIYIKGSGNDDDMVTMRNVAGEIEGSKKAIEKAIEMGYKSITILYDYAGIAKWPTNEWSANKKGTRSYANYVKSVQDKIKITFVKVAGHTNIPGNDEADRIAKESVGIVSTK